MQINNNREMRALEDKRRALIKELDAATDLYVEAVKGFRICYVDYIISSERCESVECGQCNGTGWVKK